MGAQLYIQRAAQPDTWVMSGAPATTAIWLSRDTPINYSDGTTDTLPANTPAVLPDTTTSFDRTHDVYVPYTVQGSGVLSIIKESLLPTLTSAYAPLARVELHGIKPYQPEPYLAAGGGGTVPTTTYPALLSTPGSERVLSTSDATLSSEPANWWTGAFDASAAPWVTSIESGPGHAWSGNSPPPGITDATWITDLDTSRANGVYLFCRRTFTLPAAPIVSATLLVDPDSYVDAVWVNGTSVWSEAGLDGSTNTTYEDVTETMDVAALLVPGASNLIAIRDRNGWRGGTGNPVRVAYKLTVVANAGGGIPAPGSPAEGDLLYYHAGAWVDLPIGSSGQELTVVAGDPAWTDQPADSDYTDPLTTKGDLVARTSSATTRLAVGSNGQVPTADSTASTGIRWATPTTGSVTSVAFAGPTGTSTGGSPITSSGTITLSWASQSANTVLGAPDGSSGAPTFRVLAAGDIPSLAASKITSGQLATARGGTGVDGSAATNGQLLIGNGSGYTLATITAGSGVTVTNGSGTVTIAASGSSGVTSVALTVPAFLSVAGSPITSSGTLAVTLATQSSATFFAGPATGSAATPTFRAIAASDLPAAASAGGHIHAHGHFL